MCPLGQVDIARDAAPGLLIRRFHGNKNLNNTRNRDKVSGMASAEFHLTDRLNRMPGTLRRFSVHTGVSELRLCQFPSTSGYGRSCIEVGFNQGTRQSSCGRTRHEKRSHIQRGPWVAFVISKWSWPRYIWCITWMHCRYYEMRAFLNRKLLLYLEAVQRCELQ